MADSSTTKVTQWVEDLDRKIEKNQQGKLAHEAGAGAPCMACDDCPGLDLHFWRKICKTCKCPEASHDVGMDETARFGLVLAQPELVEKNVNQKRGFTVEEEDRVIAPALFRKGAAGSEPGELLVFDWIPPDLDRDGVFEYMGELPRDYAPVTNSYGSQQRKLLWQMQIPEHDLNPKVAMQSKLQNNNIKRFNDYINTIRAKAVGQAEVLRLKKTGRSESETYETLKPHLAQWLGKASDKTLQHSDKNLKTDASAPVDYVAPDCYKCQSSIDIWNIAVYVEKDQRHFFFHPSCFKCFDCNKMLVDLLFFYHKEKFYCLRDYAKARKIPRCSSCDELIFNNQWTNADGNDFHVEHFLCYHCEEPLADKDYVRHEETLPYCIPCYETNVSKVCVACNTKIGPHMPSCSFKTAGWHYNAECYKCARCGVPLSLEEGVVFDSIDTPIQVFCSSDCKHKAAALV